MELVLRPGVAGIAVRLFVDASYGVHVDGISAARHSEVLNDRDGQKVLEMEIITSFKFTNVHSIL
jgi:hypothetical protein